MVFFSGTTNVAPFLYVQLTAQAFLSGLHPKCKDVVPITAQTRLLFEQGQDPTANCPVCSKSGACCDALHHRLLASSTGH